MYNVISNISKHFTLYYISCSSYVMISCLLEFVPYQNECILGPSGYIIHIWSNFGLSDTSHITTYFALVVQIYRKILPHYGNLSHPNRFPRSTFYLTLLVQISSNIKFRTEVTDASRARIQYFTFVQLS